MRLAFHPQVVDLMKEGKNVTIFCPTDSALKHVENEDVQLMLLDHIAVQYGHHGIMFNTLNGGKISLTPSGSDPRKVGILITWDVAKFQYSYFPLPNKRAHHGVPTN